MENYKNCIDCPFHKVISDPDPYDWFCDDDLAVVCTKKINDSIDENSKYLSDRQEFKCITRSCRPHNKKRECNVPVWCPLITEKTNE